MVMTRGTADDDRIDRLRRLLNTHDLKAGTDALASPRMAAVWLADHGFAHPRLGSADVDRLVAFRDALRDLIAWRCAEAAEAQVTPRHEASPFELADPVRRNLAELRSQAGMTQKALTDVWAWSGPELHLEGPGQWRLTGGRPGVASYLAAALADVVGAMSDGSWIRLKVCAAPGCQAAFIDRSRGARRSWCSMSVCGNRAKQMRFRERHSAPVGPLAAPPPPGMAGTAGPGSAVSPRRAGRG